MAPLPSLRLALLALAVAPTATQLAGGVPADVSVAAGRPSGITVQYCMS